MSDITERIRRRAHEIWEREGRPDGQHQDHWSRAEAEIRAQDAKPDQDAKPVGKKVSAKTATKSTRAAAENLSAVAAGRVEASSPTVAKPAGKATARDAGKPAVSSGAASRGKTARAARKDARPDPRKDAPPH